MSCDHCSCWPGSATDHPPTLARRPATRRVLACSSRRRRALLRSSARDASWSCCWCSAICASARRARACSACRGSVSGAALPGIHDHQRAHRPPLGVDQGSAGIKADAGGALHHGGAGRAPGVAPHSAPPSGHRPLRGSGRTTAGSARRPGPTAPPTPARAVSPRLRNAAPPWVRQKHGLPAARSAPAAPAGQVCGALRNPSWRALLQKAWQGDAGVQGRPVKAHQQRVES